MPFECCDSTHTVTKKVVQKGEKRVTDKQGGSLGSLFVFFYVGKVWSYNKNMLYIRNTHWSTAGTANVPLGVIMAPGALGPSTGTIKLRGIPVLRLISIGSP